MYKKSKNQEIQALFFQSEPDKACFQHDKACGDFKNLPRRTASSKVQRDKAFNIARSPKYDWYQRELPSMIYEFFDKKSSGGAIKSEIISNQQKMTQANYQTI